MIIVNIGSVLKYGGDTGGAGGAMAAPLFCVAKRKKGDKGKNERVSKQKLLKGCHQGQSIIVLAILERLEFKNFSCRPTMVADNTFQFSWPSYFEIHFAGPVLTEKIYKTEHGNSTSLK